MLGRGAFTLSLDTELAWGSLRRKDERAFAAAYPRSRETTLRLLDLLARHGISATWAIVGHLFLRSSDEVPAGDALRSIAERAHVRRGRPGDERSRPLLYASEIVEAIRSCPVPQEIGCHSFTHERADLLTAEEFRRDVRACVEVAAARGIRLRSYVFPYNVEAHHDVLADEGFLCYRSGEEPRRGARRAIARARGFAGEALRRAPATVLPSLRPSGLWVVPPSMFFKPRIGWRRLIPVRSRLDRAVAGLAAAARERRAFHLWFHPFNLTTDPVGLFGVLDAVLARAAALRDAGTIDVLPMDELAARYEAGVS